jgi:hypothetical protein
MLVFRILTPRWPKGKINSPVNPCSITHAQSPPANRPAIPSGRAAGSTVEALMYELREYGQTQLGNPNCLRRLGGLSTKQLRDVIGRLMKLRPSYPKITDELLFKLGEQL